jgi:PAS domain S-box-containing protein
MNKKQELFRSPIKLIILYLFITIFVLISGVRYYFNLKDEIRNEKYTELSIISDFKMKQISSWRNERIGDGFAISSSNIFISALNKWIKNPGNAELKNLITSHLSAIYNYNQYGNIFIFGSDYKIIFALDKNERYIGNTFYPDDSVKFKNKSTYLSGLKKEKDGEIYFDVISPLYDEGKFLGGLILRIYSSKFLFPLIQSWPTSSESSETLLITRDGDEVVYLNDLRHKNNTSLQLKYKIDSSNIQIPAVQAMFGKEGLAEGIDYRGVKVLSNIKKIPGSPWYMIAKVDISEIYKPLFEKTITLSIIVALVLISIGIGFFWIWSNQTKTMKIQYLQNESRRKALVKHFEYLIKYANDIIILSDKNKKIIDVNDRALKEYGYEKEEMLKMKIMDLFTTESDTHIEDISNTEEIEKGIIYETFHKRKDNTVLPVEVSAHIIDISGKKYYQRVVRNITERKKAEKLLRERELLYRNLFEHMEEGFAYCKMIYEGEYPKNFRYLKVNDMFGKLTGLKDVEGKLVTEVIPGIRTSDDKLFEIYSRVALTGKAEKFEFFVEALKDWYSISVYSPEKEYFVAVFDVVTKRKATEEALKDNETKFRSLFENAILGIYRTTPYGNIIDCNPALLKMLGFDSFEDMAKRNLELHGFEPGYSRSKFKEKIETEGEIIGLESSWTKKDGNSIFVRENAKAIRDETGKFLFYEGTVEDITLRKEIEIELITSEKKYRSLHESMMDGFALVDMEGKLIDFNESYRKMLGYSKEELINLTYSEITPLKWHEYEKKVVEQILKNGYSDVYEKEYIKKDGTVIPIELRTFLLKNDSGRNEGMWAVVRDITDRKKTEEVIQESEVKFRTLFESMNEGVALHELVYDEKGLPVDYRIVDVNPSYEKHTGISIENAKNQLASEFYNIKIPPYLEIYSKVAETGIPYFFETYFPPLKKHFEISVFSPKKNWFATVFTDITERKSSDEKLRESEKRLSFALETNQTGAWDLNLIDHTSNRTLIHDRIFGYDELLPEWTYEMFLQHVLPEDRGEVDRRFSEAIKNQTNWNFECRILRKDGVIRWIWAIGGHEINSDGKSLKMSGIVQDITDRKKTEEEIRKLNEELEQRVVERTAQLQNLNRELEAFSYSVSHDLRAPLRSIDGFSLAIYEDYYRKLDEKGREYLERIRKATSNMDELIDSMLKLSRVTRYEIHEGSVDLTSIVKELTENAVNQDGKRIAEFIIQDNVTASGDLYLLRILLDNLIANAWKFTSKKKKTVIEFGTIKKDSKTIYFVKDNGSGFEMKYYDKLFGAFQRLHSKKDFPGTGVGLATAQRIVSRHNGKIWAESELNSGTTFYFTLK